MKYLLAGVCFFLLIVANGYAQTKYTEYQNSPDLDFPSSAGSSTTYTVSYPNRTIRVHSNYLWVKFSSNREALTGADLAGVQVQATLNGNQYVEQLAIGQDQPESHWLVKLPADKSVTTISFNIISSSFDGTLAANNTVLSVGHELTYGYLNIKDYSLTVEKTIDTNGKQLVLSVKEYQSGEGADAAVAAPYSFYQVEQVRLYNINENNPSYFLDWSNASSTVIASTMVGENRTLSVPITEGEGHYAYRVRAISEGAENSLANVDNYGRWWQTSQLSGGLNTALAEQAEFFYFADKDADKNYIYSRTFTEAGKTKETVTYADRLLNTRQSLVYLPSENRVVRTQTIPDYSGRPVVTTLPVPDDQIGRNLLYKQKVAKDGSGNTYSAEDFDRSQPQETMDLGPYYSGDNAEGVADDEGYGFSRTTFYNDGSGRVFEQSGVGKTHSIGNKTTKTLYGSASQSELNYLFGDEAPRADNVFKTYTIDPNNVVSVSYTNKEGQVIASGLSTLADITSNLEDIQETGQAVTVEDITKTSVRIGNQLESTKKLIIPSAGQPLQLTYRVKQNSVDQLCGSVNVDCQYSLLLEVYRLNTPTEQSADNAKTVVEEVFTQSFDLGEASTDGQGYKAVTANTNLTEAGTYLIRKTITPGEVAGSSVSNSRKQVEPILTMVSDWLDKVQSVAEMQEFYVHLKAFGTAFTNGNLATYQNSKFPANPGPDFMEIYNSDPESFKFIVYESEAGDVVGFTVSTICCKGISVPIDWTPPFECPETITLNNMPDLLDWAVQRLSTGVINSVAEVNSPAQVKDYLVENFMQGWDENTFKQMTYHMLTDVYLGSEKFADEDTEERIPSVQYTCDELYKCWSGAVSMLKQQFDVKFKNEADREVSGNYDDRQGDEAESDGHDIFIDEKALQPKKGPFKKWRGKRRAKKVSKEVRNLTFPQPVAGEDGREFTGHLVRDFLECTGFRFAKVLTPLDPYPLSEDVASSYMYYETSTDPNSVLRDQATEMDKVAYALYVENSNGPAPYIPLKSWNSPGESDDPNTWIGPAEEYIEYDEAGEEKRVLTPYYPFIKNPIYAFKYFHYDNLAQADYARLENSTCFTDPNDCYQVSGGKIQGSWVSRGDGTKVFQPTIVDCCTGDDCTLYRNYPATGGNKKIVAEFCDYGQAVCSVYPEQWSSEQRLMFYETLRSFKPVEYEAPVENIVTDYQYEDIAEPTGQWYELDPDTDEQSDAAYDNGYPQYINATTYSSLPALASGYSAASYYKPLILKEDGENRNAFSLIAYLSVQEQVECTENCEDRRREIEQRIFAELNRKCYNIDGCYITDGGDVVLRDDIKAIADDIIAQCKLQCSVTTFTYTTENCRTYETPKYSTQLGPDVIGTPIVDLAVSKSTGYSFTDRTAYSGKYTENGKEYFSFKKYIPNTNPKERYGLSFYEATLIDQTANWDIEILFPCQCPGGCKEEEIAVTPGTDTYVSPEDFVEKDGPLKDKESIASPAINMSTTVDE